MPADPARGVLPFLGVPPAFGVLPAFGVVPFAVGATPAERLQGALTAAPAGPKTAGVVSTGMPVTVSGHCTRRTPSDIAATSDGTLGNRDGGNCDNPGTGNFHIGIVGTFAMPAPMDVALCTAGATVVLAVWPEGVTVASSDALYHQHVCSKLAQGSSNP